MYIRKLEVHLNQRPTSVKEYLVNLALQIMAKKEGHEPHSKSVIDDYEGSFNIGGSMTLMVVFSGNDPKLLKQKKSVVQKSRKTEKTKRGTRRAKTNDDGLYDQPHIGRDNNNHF